MIRLATNKDTLIAVDLLREFLRETSYSQAEEAGRDRDHLCKLVWTFHQFGYIWLAFHKDEPVGILMSVKESNMWLPSARELREVVWFVKPEHRRSTIGGKLFLTYCQKGEELLESGEIQGYFTTRMTTTDSIDYESRGFRQTEVTYIKE
jgi:predicted GNAT family acetyltransferase